MKSGFEADFSMNLKRILAVVNENRAYVHRSAVAYLFSDRLLRLSSS